MGADQTKSLIRQWREDQGMSLERACELFEEAGFDKPSTAKLSRIERDQVVPPEMIPAIQAIMGIPAKEQRPDLALLFSEKQAEPAQ